MKANQTDTSQKSSNQGALEKGRILEKLGNIDGMKYI